MKVHKSRHLATEIAWFTLPPLLALLLAFPCFRFSFLFDDFDFLIRAQSFDLGQLLPDARSAFYRPISRELYFGLLTLLGRNNPLWGHVLNAAGVAVSVALLAGLARRLAGDRVGLIAGLLFASLSPVPLLIGWISCSQDILAILFTLAAFRSQLAGRPWIALAFAAAALLSKETALLLFPILAGLPWILERDLPQTRRNALRLAGLSLVWGAAHPKMRSLLLDGAVTGAGGYVGIDNSMIPDNVSRMLGSLLNIPPTGRATPWPSELSAVLFAALGVLALAYWVGRRKDSGRTRPKYSRGSVLVFGALLTALPGILTAVFVKHWFSYYGCFPWIGGSILLALGLARTNFRAAFAVVAVFLGLGVWSRGSDGRERFQPSERAWGTISADLARVQAEMKKLRPSLPDSERVYVSIHLPRDRGIHLHLLRFQAPRVWYEKPGLCVLPAGRFDPQRPRATYFWVSPSCDVFQMILPSLRVRCCGRRPSYADYERARRLLALGLFRAGEVDRAVDVILTMRQGGVEAREFDRRLAAALYMTAGRRSEAQCLLRGLPAMDRRSALPALAGLIGAVGVTGDFGASALAAFGVAQEDVEAWRYLMDCFVSDQRFEPAYSMAFHLLSLRPTDEEASMVVARIRDLPEWQAVTIAPAGSPSWWTPK